MADDKTSRLPARFTVRIPEEFLLEFVDLCYEQYPTLSAGQVVQVIVANYFRQKRNEDRYRDMIEKARSTGELVEEQIPDSRIPVYGAKLDAPKAEPKEDWSQGPGKK